MTHTPGPWEATSDWVLSVRKDQRTITLVANCKLSERRHKEGEANAHLIAAAPDLLDALEADELFHDHVGHCDHCDTGDCKVGLELGLKARIARRDAIAKARGRPPKKES